MSDSKVEINIPKTLIEDTIRAEIIRQLPNKEAFAAKVIEEMMRTPVDHYNRENTVFREAIRKMIVETAQLIFKEWLAANEAAIRKALHAQLTRDKTKILAKIAEDIASGMLGLYPSITLNLKDRGA